MHAIRLSLLTVSLAALALGVGRGGRTLADDGHDHGHHQQSPAVDDHQGHASHGGTTIEHADHHFEVVFEKDGIRVYPQGPGITPEVVSRLNGRAFFMMPGAKAYTQPYPLRPRSQAEGGPADVLSIRLDLSKMPVEGAKVTFQIWKLPESTNPTAQFTVPFTFAGSRTITVSKATDDDKKIIAAQLTCPISGEELGSMGPPLKVARGGDALFLCCQGCLKKVQAEPDAVFGKTLAFAKPTKADEEAITAQKTCPVSGQPLDAMGGPIKVELGAQSVFLCCPSCAKAVKKTPEKFLSERPSGEGRPDGHDHADHH